MSCWAHLPPHCVTSSPLFSASPLASTGVPPNNIHGHSRFPRSLPHFPGGRQRPQTAVEGTTTMTCRAAAGPLSGVWLYSLAWLIIASTCALLMRSRSRHTRASSLIKTTLSNNSAMSRAGVKTREATHQQRVEMLALYYRVGRLKLPLYSPAHIHCRPMSYLQ